MSPQAGSTVRDGSILLKLFGKEFLFLQKNQFTLGKKRFSIDIRYAVMWKCLRYGCWHTC